MRLEADAAGGVLHVRADARTADGYANSLRRLTARVTLPDGRTRELALDPTGAGSYGADCRSTGRARSPSRCGTSGSTPW